MISPETVTLTRAEYEALLEELEDAQDLAAVAAAEAREAALGKEAARSDYLSIELVERLLDGEHPIAIWRKHRGMGLGELAAATGLAPHCVAAIEAREQPGSFADVAKLAAALHLSLDDIAIWLRNGGEDYPDSSDAPPRLS
jgi:hypothetical protein